MSLQTNTDLEEMKKETEAEAMEEMECWHTDNHLGKCEKHKEEKEKCYRCGEKDDPDVMLFTPIGYMCDTCADDMGVTRSFSEND